MNMIKVISVIMLVLASLNVEANDQSSFTDNQMMVSYLFKDPSSVQIAEWKEVDSSHTESLDTLNRFGNRLDDTKLQLGRKAARDIYAHIASGGVVVITSINAKNEYGGYVGFKRRCFAMKDGNVVPVFYVNEFTCPTLYRLFN